MAEADRATCPRCGAPLSADDPAALCRRCVLSDNHGDKTEISPVIPSSPGRVRRKLTLASAVAAIGAMLFGGLWFGNRRGQQPSDANAHYNLGNTLQAQGKLDEAVAEYRTAIRLKPDFAWAHNNLGNTLQAQGKLEDAIAEFRTLIRLKPDFADAHFNLGNALIVQGKGRLEEAIAEYRAAIRLQPNLYQAHYNLGTTLQAQGKPEVAIAEYRTAIRLKPDDAEAHYGLGTALKAQGKLAKAVAEYRKARDNAQPGSKLAQAIERELTETDH